MKKVSRVLGIIALIAILGLAVFSCDDGDSGPSVPGVNDPALTPPAGYTAMTAAEAEEFIDELLSIVDIDEILGEALGSFSVVSSSRAVTTDTIDLSEELGDLGPNVTVEGTASYSFDDSETSPKGNANFNISILIEEGNELLGDAELEIIGIINGSGSGSFSASINESTYKASGSVSAKSAIAYGITVLDTESKKYVKLIGSISLSVSAKASNIDIMSDDFSGSAASGSGSINVKMAAYGESKLFEKSQSVSMSVNNDLELVIKGSGFLFDIDEKIDLTDLFSGGYDE